MYIDRINIDKTRIRRVGCAHCWAKATLLVLMCKFNFACEASTPKSVSMTLPQVRLIGDIGRVSDGLPLTASVSPRLHLGDPAILQLKITSVLDHPYFDAFDEPNWKPETFAVWLLHDGEQVPLTKIGKEKQARTYDLGGVGGGPPLRTLAPGASHSKSIDLVELFQISSPGKYTVIAERTPTRSNDPTREIDAVKTSFTLLPNN